jgi:hypothetical protein
MGLDMYLSRVANPTEQMFIDAYDDKLTGLLYWRKVNALHKFFCDRGTLEAGGKENVGRYIISRSDLIDLVFVMKRILVDNSVKLAEETLPTQSGFFFGSTEYDSIYFDDLKQAVSLISAELDAVPDHEVWFYEASW